MARRRRAQPSRTPIQRRVRAWPRLVAFLACVLVVKLIVLAQIGSHPLLQPDAGLDTAAYVQLARRVLAGDFFLGPALYYLSPLYIYFLAGALAVSDSFTFVRVIQVALGTAAVAGMFVSARAWFGEFAAWSAAVLAALTGVFTFYEIVLFQSSLDSFLTSAALAFLALALRRSPDDRPGISRLAAAAGLMAGLQILNRPNIAIAALGVLFAVAVARRGRIALLFSAGLLVALAPVVSRNLQVSHQFALVSSQGGLNFYIGNNAAATGQYVAVPGVRANIEGQSDDTRQVAERAVGHPLTDSQVSSYFTGLALEWIRRSPAAAARLFGRKLALVFNARHQWLDFSYPYYAYDIGSALRYLFVGPWLLVPLGLAGFLAAPPSSNRAAFYAWAAFVPLYSVAVALFFVAERYRLPLLVPLCVGAGGALQAVRDAFVESAPAPTRTRRLAVIAAVLAVGMVLTAWPFAVPDGRFEERLRLSKVLMNRGDYGGAVSELQQALALSPDDTTTEFNLGMALVSNGQPAEGIPHIRRAVDAGVPMEGARYALANVLLVTGDRDGAIQLLRTFFPQPSESAESCYRVGVLAMNAGAPAVADRYLRRALELRPGWPEAAQALAENSRGRS